jgi:hypothetical protein
MPIFWAQVLSSVQGFLSPSREITVFSKRYLVTDDGTALADFREKQTGGT